MTDPNQTELEQRIADLEKRLEHIVHQLIIRGGIDVDHESKSSK